MLVVGNKRTKNAEGFWVQIADVLDGGKTVCSVEEQGPRDSNKDDNALHERPVCQRN